MNGSVAWDFDLLLPIRRVDQTLVRQFRSAPSWRNVSRKEEIGATDEITFDEFVTEQHHQYYGRPWIMGQLYFEELIKRGLHPTDRVLDVGCGAGRLGIKLIPYLDAGRYCGIESHLRSLVGFASYEARMHGLAAKRPFLLLSDEFEVSAFDLEFDIVLDFATTLHLGVERTRAAYTRIRRVAASRARIFMAFPPTLGIQGMQRVGFGLVDRRQVTYRLPAPAPSIEQLTDEWHEFVAL